jgi:anthranilate synthase/aminodeoxychorismate synthase-like glutamine amidotransferase
MDYLGNSLNSAERTPYDNATSLLTASNVQDAIDEIDTSNDGKVDKPAGTTTEGILPVWGPTDGQLKNTGISIDAIHHFSGKLPILGVCLGHQSIGQAFGGKIVRAKQVMHGKTSPVYHKDVGVFAQLPNPVETTRYHSLVIEQASLPECLEVTAWTQTATGELDEIMGVRHKTLPIEGVQFHPESILTEQGHAMLKNFLQSSVTAKP